MNTLRTPSHCSELVRTPEEVLAYAALPRALRTRRMATHLPKTADTYISQLARFIRYCLMERLSPLPASPQTVLSFFKYGRETLGMGVPGLLGHAAAINCYHYSNEQPVPESRELARYKLILRKEHVVVKATPANTEQTRAMVALAALCARNRATRDVFLLLFLFATALRPSEARELCLEDVYMAPRGMSITIRSSKYNRNKARLVTVGLTSNPAYDPMYALQRWLTQAKITSGYLFRPIDNQDQVADGSKPIGEGEISDIIKHYATAIGMRGKLCAYTMRRGCATTASHNGASIGALKTHLRHVNEKTTLEYIDQQPLSFDQSITGLVLP